MGLEAEDRGLGISLLWGILWEEGSLGKRNCLPVWSSPFPLVLPPHYSSSSHLDIIWLPKTKNQGRSVSISLNLMAKENKIKKTFSCFAVIWFIFSLIFYFLTCRADDNTVYIHELKDIYSEIFFSIFKHFFIIWKDIFLLGLSDLMLNSLFYTKYITKMGLQVFCVL